MKTRQFQNRVKFVKTHFGLAADFHMPEGCDIIIVCTNNGYGLQPVDLKLPHQLYKKRIKELENTLDEYYGEIVVIPASSKNYITISEKDYKEVPKTINKNFKE